MRQIPYLIAAAAIGGLTLYANPVAASPLASAFTSGGADVAELNEGLVQNVHYRACRFVRFYDDDEDEWVKVRRCYRHRHHVYPFGVPFVGLRFGFDDDDDHFRFRRKHHRDWDD